MYVHSFTGLPVLWIETENREDIVSKEDYLNAQFRLVEDVVTRGTGDIINFDAKIKGRGNSTWLLPKKPYRIKCDKNISILGMPEGKSWVLLANYADKSMLRNHLAMYLGAMSNLDYTPRMKMVEVMLNGRYQGTYQLSEKVQIAKNRVVTDGFLLEMDSYADKEQDAIWFRTKRLPQPINIKDSKSDLTSEDIYYIKEYFQKAEDVLYSDEFKDYNTGWRKYFDEESFADWYIINEIAKNWDAVRWSSTYMTLPKSGKLKMGPLWDYDIAFGNASREDGCDASPEGWQIRKQVWFSRLFEDESFVELVKERFIFFVDAEESAFNELNEQAQYLKRSAYENDCKWNILYNHTWRNLDIWGNYLNEAQLLKEWLRTRMDWIVFNFN